MPEITRFSPDHPVPRSLRLRYSPGSAALALGFTRANAGATFAQGGSGVYGAVFNFPATKRLTAAAPRGTVRGRFRPDPRSGSPLSPAAVIVLNAGATPVNARLKVIRGNHGRVWRSSPYRGSKARTPLGRFAASVYKSLEFWSINPIPHLGQNSI